MPIIQINANIPQGFLERITKALEKIARAADRSWPEEPRYEIKQAGPENLHQIDDRRTWQRAVEDLNKRGDMETHEHWRYRPRQ